MARTPAAALDALGGLPGVAEGVDAAREACARLRRHPALRRRGEQARVEATVRAARASAALEGAPLPLALVRDVARGAAAPGDAAGRVVTGSLRAATLAPSLGGVLATAPAQALARLHTAAAGGTVPQDALGRPRAGPGVAERLAALADLLRAPAEVPALLVAAVAHAEIATLRPFGTADGLVARAIARTVVVARGLDPTGVAVQEAGHLAAGMPYPAALAAYASGTAEGLAAWLRHCADAAVLGAGEGAAVCDAVSRGTPGDRA